MITGFYEKLTLGLKYTWAISRGATNEKTNFIVNFQDEHGNLGQGEIAPNTRYGETLEGVESQLNDFLKIPMDNNLDVPGFSAILDSYQLYNSVRFGLESAFISLYCLKSKTAITDFLKIPLPQKVYTAYTIPIMDIGLMEDFYQKHGLFRFKTLKIKIGAENGEEMIKEVSRFSPLPMIVDANEAYQDPDKILRLLENTKSSNITVLEQPFPAKMAQAYVQLKPLSSVPVFADESVTSEFDGDEIVRQFHGVNMKLMKAGGWIKGVEILKSAKSHGLQTMIGCMVETSLAISHGLQLCGLADVVDLDSFMVLSDEPFGRVKEINGEIILNN